MIVREVALREVMNYLSNEQWTNEQWTKILPELGTNVHRIVKKATGNVDPYSQLKKAYTNMALEFYPKLKSIVEDSEDPLLSAAKVAVAGNIIDFGLKLDISLENEVENVMKNKLAINDIAALRKSLIKSERALYLADNAGETVFDRILIEELSARNVEVTYAVKGSPILSDATFQDAEIAGITQIANVISIGTDCVGVLFEECSAEFLEEFDNSSFVISKGQANYESLSDIKNKEIFFLLRAKCPFIADDIKVKTCSAILKRTFLC